MHFMCITIKIPYNPVLHGKTKHIGIQNHFVRDHIARGDIELSFMALRINWWISSPSHWMRGDSLSLGMS
jgi:hypothetical protein